MALTNSTENDVLLANHMSRVDQINRIDWMRSTAGGRDSARNPFRVKQAMIRLAGVAGIAVALLLSGGNTLAATPQAGITECEQQGCEVVTSNKLVRSARATEATVATATTLPSGRFDPHLTR